MKILSIKQFIVVLSFLFIHSITYGQTTAPIVISVWDGESGTNGKYPAGDGAGDIHAAFGSVDGVRGDGSKANPYLITNVSEFAFLAKKVNSGTNYVNKFFRLTVNIDLNHRVWTPIGGLDGNRFSGMFDGNNLNIKNIYIDQHKVKYIGLFGCISDSWSQSEEFGVKNIIVDGGFVHGLQNVGGIIGEIKNDVNVPDKPVAIVDNCHNISITTIAINDNLTDYSGAGNNVGGIAGRVSGYVKISNCVNFANINGFSYVGGIVGDSDYTKSDIDYVTKISGCINFGSIGSMRGKIGGIVGDNGNIVELCSNHGRIDGGASLYETGGVAGFNNCIVRECFNTGSVSGFGVVGGVVGGMSNTMKERAYPSELSDCYNVGDVVGIENNMGGIVGRVNSANDNPPLSGVLQRVYNVGVVGGGNKYEGEIIGEFVNGTNVDVKECYYDNQFGRVLKAFGLGKVEPDNASKDTRSMIGAATLFGSAETWQYQENNYPMLKRMMTNTYNDFFAEISTLAVVLANPTTRWNAIDENFTISTSFGAKWRSGNVDVVNINDGLATITSKGGSAILIASIGDIERVIPIETVPDKKNIHTTVIKMNGYGKMIGQGKVLTSGHSISVIGGGMEYLDIIPEDGYYLSSLIFTKIADVSGDRTEVKEHENKDGIVRNLDADYKKCNLRYKLEALEGFTNTEIEAIFSPIAKWDGDASQSHMPFRDGQTNSYLIYKPSELVWAIKNVESIVGTGKLSIKLANHLDMGGLPWMSIEGVNYSFGGIFDGNMKTISNLDMSIKLGKTNPADNCGFIKILEEGGEVSNLGLIGLTDIYIEYDNDVEATVNAGLLVGENKGIIRNCYAIANIVVGSNDKSKANIGGLVGINNGGKVESSYVVVPIQCTSYNEDIVEGAPMMCIGGVVGQNINGGELKYVYYDNQMCAEKLAVGNITPNNYYCNGLETSLVTNALTIPIFDEFNASGVWISLPGYYPMHNLSNNNLAVRVSASPILLAYGETTGNMRILNDGVKSNFSLWAPKTTTDSEVKWSVEKSYPQNPLTISEPYNAVSIAKVDPNLTQQTSITLLASIKNSTTGEEIKCKRTVMLVSKSNGTKKITVLITGISIDDKIESGGVDGTVEAKTPTGASFSFGTGSTSEITLIPAPGRYLLSLTSKPSIISLESESVNVLKDVSVNYARGTLIYRVANINADMVLTATFSDVPSWTGGNSMEPHNYQNQQYLIYHPDELAWMAKAVNDGNSFLGCPFKIMNDINLNNGDYNWISIGGHGDISKIFKGSFNGNNLTINNLTINAPDKSYVGLFGHLDIGSKIWNLTLNNCKVRGKEYVGAFVGYFEVERSGHVDHNIENCRIGISKDNPNPITDYYVKGTNNVGGIVGYGSHGTVVTRSHNNGIAVSGGSLTDVQQVEDPTISNEGVNIGGIIGFNDGIINECTSYGTIKGLMYVGGIVGFNQGLRGTSHISSCMNYGDVIGIKSQIGGIAGASNGDAFRTTISNCININGKITGGNMVAGIVGHNRNSEMYMCYNVGGDITALGIDGEGIAGEGIAGGVVAYNEGRVLSYSFNTGMVTGISSVGGIAGKGTGLSSGGVSYCFNLGIVKGDSYVGGIVGGIFGKISQCYNAGDIKGRVEGKNAIHNVGAITGYTNERGVSDCFYDKQMVAVKGINNIDTDETKGYLTSEIITDKKGFKDKSAWVWAGDQVGSAGELYPALYPVLKAWYPLGFENNVMQPILLKYTPSGGETISDYEHVRWMLSDFSINGIEKEIILDEKVITTLTSEPNIVTFKQEGDDVIGTFKRTDEDQTVTIGIGAGILVSEQPLRKVELTILQGDQFRKIFRGIGNWTDEPLLPTDSSGWFTEGLDIENVGTGVYIPSKIPTADENVVIDGHVTIKDGVKAVSGNTGVNPKGCITIDAGGQLRVNRMRNTDVNNLKIFNDGNKSASFIVNDSSSVKPYMTLTQTITTGDIDDKYEYQLISVPIPTVREGKPVVDIFKDAWLDRYNQSDAIWERYEEVYHGKRWFDIERFRGYSINFEEPSRDLVFKGQSYAEDANYRVSYSEHIAADGNNYGGLNLIGNPYTTAMKVDWALLDPYTQSQVENNIWMWDGTQYMTYPGNVGDVIGDGIIPACQGFWVRVNPLIINSNDITGSFPQTLDLSFPYAETISENNTGLHKSDQNSYLPFIRLKVEGNRYSDELAIIESESCSEGYDSGWDGEKWFGIANAPQFYSVEDRILAVNSKNDITETVLGFVAGEDSQYTIKPIGSTNIKDVKLVDLKMGISHDILNSHYTFTSSKSDAINRFILKAESTKGIEERIDDENWCKVFSYGKMITVIGGEGKMEVIDMQGKIIKSIAVASDKCSISVDKAGVYVVRIIGDNRIMSEKVIIN